MSFFAAAKAVGKMGLQVTKSAVNSVSEAANKLGDQPTSLVCTNCKNNVDVPANVFEWACHNAQCHGIRFPGTIKICTKCTAPKPECDVKLVCPICDTPNKVFETNALAHLNDAKVGATKLAVTSQAYVEKQIQELKSVPAHLPCAHCKLELGVPAEIFNWCCEGCKVWHDHTHATDKACPECNVVRSPENSTPPQLRCPQCAEVTVVPYSNASKHVAAAKAATKEAYGAVKSASITAYNNLKAAPVEFNCEHCSFQLQAIYPEEGKERGSTSEPYSMVCSSCSQTTKVPKTVFANSVAKTAHSIQGYSAKAYYEVSGKRYLTCDVCNIPVVLPKQEEGQPLPAYEVPCSKCKKVFSSPGQQ